jgi:wyosine [tRNA(Phe)-imidazoG37] synthetase (radical SAM superfamily)
MTIERREFYRPEDIVRAVRRRLEKVHRSGESVDFLAFVPDGEPTLDRNLGREIALLREFRLPIAVITNTSLLGLPDVREELAFTDWVSLKIDTVDEGTWRRLNHPHKGLALTEILAAATGFRRKFAGTLVTETMLVAGLNDTEEHAAATAAFLSRLRPDTAYLSVPTRPPAVPSVRLPSSEAMVRYHTLLAKLLAKVEYLMGYEGTNFSTAGDPRENLLSVTAVHPMRRDAVEKLLVKSGATWDLVEGLLRDGSLSEARYAGHRYYLGRPHRG